MKIRNGVAVLIQNIAMLSLWIPFHVNAVVIIGGNGTLNNTPPPDDPGFANVGRRYVDIRFGGQLYRRDILGTGVFLGSVNGQHWILSARHVQEFASHDNRIQFGNRNYRIILNSAVTLTNPPGQPRGITDLELFRISGNPNLPRLKISETVPELGSAITMIGSGWTRHPDQIGWSFDRSDPDEWILRETDDPDPEYTGFKKADPETYEVRWGTNVVTELMTTNIVGNVQRGTSTRAFDFTFDMDGGDNEAGGVEHDSGGGVFYKNGDEWELAGTLLSKELPFVTNGAGNLQGVGELTQTISVFGFDSRAADLSFYRDQIIRITNIPEPFETSLLAGMLIAFWICISRIHRHKLLASPPIQKARKESGLGNSRGLSETCDKKESVARRVS